MQPFLTAFLNYRGQTLYNCLFICIFAVAYVTVVWNTESFCYSAVDCSLHSYVRATRCCSFFYINICINKNAAISDCIYQLFVPTAILLPKL